MGLNIVAIRTSTDSGIRLLGKSSGLCSRWLNLADAAVGVWFTV